MRLVDHLDQRRRGHSCGDWGLRAPQPRSPRKVFRYPDKMIAEAPILGGMPRPPVGYEPNLRWAVAHALEPDVEPSAKLRLAGHPAGAVSAAREALDVANASGTVDDLALA